MKKPIIFLILIQINYLSAQNWNPILVNEKMNYRHSDSAYISNTIWVDSAFLVGSDSVFYLNRIVKDVPGYPEIVLRNQPQFLLRQMVMSVSGTFTFSNPGSFVIYVLANTGESWVFDEENNIIAQVISESVENIFGIQDSIKWISLSDGNEIRLSKSFGILKFPDFENGGYYELVGIQDTEYGESVPDFWDIFDFEVGDVFQYYEYATNADGSGDITRKITITSKGIVNNSYQYGYDGIYWCLYFDIGIGWGIESYQYSDNYIFTDSSNHPSNLFPGQIFLLLSSWSGYGTYRVFTRSKILKNQETDIVSKEYGWKTFQSNDPYIYDVFYELDTSDELLYRYEYINIIDLPCGMKGLGYGNTLGGVFSSEGFFEYSSELELVGYIKDGDTVGTITPDSLLFTEINPNLAADTKIKVYPNPTDKLINMQISNANYAADKISIEIRNMQGQLLMQQAQIVSETVTLDVEKLPPGIYLCIIKNKEGIIHQEKLVVY